MHQRGYSAVGVAEICAAARTAKGSFYYFWPSKRDLARAMLERSWRRVRAEVFDRTLHGDGTLRERLERFGRTLARISCAWGGRQAREPRVLGCRFGNFTAELSSHDEVIRAAVQAVFEDMIGRFEREIARAVEAGEAPARLDPRTGAESLLAHLEGLMLLAKGRNDADLLKRFGVDAARLLGLAGGAP